MLQLLVDAAGQIAAIDGDDLTGDEGGGFGGEEDGSAYQLIELAVAPDRRAHQNLVTTWRLVQQLLIQLGREESGCDGVHADAVAGKLDGQRLGQRAHACLAGTVGSHLVKGDEGGKRCNINDSSPAVAHHSGGDNLARAEGAGEVGFEDAMPIFFGALESGHPLRRPSGIDEDVYLAEGRERLIVEGLKRAAVEDIGGSFEGAPSALA